ncbi:uncharacterized protein ZBAI_06590 [Zygosaccharomyces bailii ISA1307]|nr:uncharacterized protein ZBAI_06590 [Zygosaccharomyces bailii ISA1307]
MPEPCRSFTNDDDSSSVYTTEASILRPKQQHNSLFVEDFDNQDAGHNGGNKSRGLSVYLDDSRLIIPPTHSDLSSTESSNAAEGSSHSEYFPKEEITQPGHAVETYSTIRDGSIKQTAEDDKNSNSIDDLSKAVRNSSSCNNSRVTSSQSIEGTQEFIDEQLAQSSIETKHINQALATESDTLPPPPPPLACIDEEQSSQTAESTGATTYHTVNDSVGHSLVDSLDQRFEDARDHINTSQQISQSSGSSSGMRTVSTSILIDDEEPSMVASSRNELREMDDMVKMLEDEAQLDVAPLGCSTRPTSTVDFTPQDFNLSRRSISESVPPSPETPLSPDRSWQKSRGPHSPSLLNKILVPTVPERAAVEIPVLRPVIGSPRQRDIQMVIPEEPEETQNAVKQAEPEKLEEQSHIEAKEPEEQSHVEVKQPGKELQANPNQLVDPQEVKPTQQLAKLAIERETLHRPEGLTDSQVDLALESLEQFQDELRLKMVQWEATAGRGPIQEPRSQGYIPNQMPVQRVDSSSMHSSNASVESRFLATYSIGRIILVLLGCMVVPPLFFMIAIGRKGGFSDYKVMRMITKSDYRSTLLQGFLWDIDVSWFRRSCLYFGILETLGAFIGIGVGFGVGLGTE